MQLSEIDLKRVQKLVFEKYGNTSRINHILGVEKMAKKLSSIYGVSELKASIASLVHDYYRYEDIEEMKNYLSSEVDILECEKYPFLYHAYCSAKALKEVFEIEDDEINNAIKYHVLGNKEMSMLDKIIFISDYTEETREYESSIKVREILVDKGIDEAIYYATKYSVEYHGTVHEIQKHILKKFEENKQ